MKCLGVVDAVDVKEDETEDEVGDDDLGEDDVEEAREGGGVSIGVGMPMGCDIGGFIGPADVGVAL